MFLLEKRSLRKGPNTTFLAGYLGILLLLGACTPPLKEASTALAPPPQIAASVETPKVEAKGLQLLGPDVDFQVVLSPETNSKPSVKVTLAARKEDAPHLVWRAQTVLLLEKPPEARDETGAISVKVGRFQERHN